MIGSSGAKTDLVHARLLLFHSKQLECAGHATQVGTQTLHDKYGLSLQVSCVAHTRHLSLASTVHSLTTPVVYREDHNTREARYMSPSARRSEGSIPQPPDLAHDHDGTCFIGITRIS